MVASRLGVPRRMAAGRIGGYPVVSVADAVVYDVRMWID